jgi:SAM-dependent methyltransferase
MHDNNDIFDKEYKLFEDRFRGSEAVIRQRLSVYLPLIAGVTRAETGRKALDLGSGRGEWLALLSEHGWNATGIEPNDIAEAARGIDAEIVKADALDYLRESDACSFALVTAFHVVEHLDSDYLLQMLREIRRVLTPGGLLILETPNPENLTVASWSFHLDPTHKIPIPPILLQYHVETAGFPAHEIVRLNGHQDDYDLGPHSAVLSVLFRSGPDYAVVARTPGADDELFAALIKNFVFQTTQRNPADIQALIELTKHSDSVIENQAKLIANFAVLQLALDQRTRELSAVYKSFSWRSSRPLRILARLVRGLLSRQKRIVRIGLSKGRRQLRNRPKLTAMLIKVLAVPRLKRRLKQFAEPRAKGFSVWSIDVDSQALADWEDLTRKKELR